jgi:hypothetical protein
MSQDQNAGQSHNIKINSSSFERAEEFRYLGTTLTYQNYIQEEIKTRLKLGNACYHSLQNLLSSSLRSNNIKIKIYIWSRDSSVSIATCYGLEGPGIESRWGEIFRTYPDQLLYKGYGVFPGVKAASA